MTTRRRGDQPVQGWPVSDHFDGSRFFNPTLPRQGFPPPLRSVVRMSREPRHRWPQSVRNEGTPRLNESLARDDLAVTFVNHATFLVQIDGAAILTDPHWSERASPVS